MIEYTVTGKYHRDMGVKQIHERFKQRVFIVQTSQEINGQVYVNYVKLQLVQNKCDLLDRYKIGDTICVSFNLKGVERVIKNMNPCTEEDMLKYEYITNLDAWRIEPVKQLV